MRTTSKLRRRLFAVSLAALAVSGMAQMPIFKRYYIADIPGLAWTGDFFFTHRMHAVAAILYLYLLAEGLGGYLVRRSRGDAAPLSGRQKLWAGLHAGIVTTGVLLMAKNLSGWSWSAWTTRFLDWSHLGLAMAMGITALTLVFATRAARKRARAYGPRSVARRNLEESFEN